MATIRRRGPFQFQVIVKRKGYANQVKTWSSRREAERWARDVEAEMDRGAFVSRREAEQMSLAEAIRKYREEVTGSKKGAKQEGYKLDILLESPLAGRSLASIRPTDIAQYRDQRMKGAMWRVGRRRGVRSPEEAKLTRSTSKWRGKPVSGATVRIELSALSTIFDTARIEWGMPISNPVRDVKKPPKAKERERRLHGEDEERRMMAALAEYGDGWAMPFAKLAIETGMRRGEWGNLDWSDVDVEAQTMTLHEGETKNGEGRVVPLSTRAIAILKDLGILERGPVLPRQPGTFTAAFSRSRERARAKYIKECERKGVEPDPGFLVNLHLHDMRHEATSRLFERGLDVMEAASVTGHKTLAMLKRYTHLKAQKLAKKLG